MAFSKSRARRAEVIAPIRSPPVCAKVQGIKNTRAARTSSLVGEFMPFIIPRSGKSRSKPVRNENRSLPPSPQRDGTNEVVGRLPNLHRISQGTAETAESDLDHVATFYLYALDKAETVGSEEMNMHVSRPPMSVKLEVMMLDVFQAVAHLGNPGAEGLRPVHTPCPFDR